MSSLERICCHPDFVVPAEDRTLTLTKASGSSAGGKKGHLGSLWKKLVLDKVKGIWRGKGKARGEVGKKVIC